jgi:uncharacterized Fe-S cluster-containing protein
MRGEFDLDVLAQLEGILTVSLFAENYQKKKRFPVIIKNITKEAIFCQLLRKTNSDYKVLCTRRDILSDTVTVILMFMMKSSVT